MLNLLYRKTFLKKFSKDTQNTILKLRGKLFKITTYIYLTYIFLIEIPGFLMIFVSYALNDTQFIMFRNILIILAIIYTLITYLFILTKFNDTFLARIEWIAIKFYFLFVTKRGCAISNKDFKNIKNNNEVIYTALSEFESAGYCYNVCFELLKLLKKGHIKFIAIKRFLHINDIENEYTMHVIYINNDFAYDPYSNKQFKTDELLDIYSAKIYKDFTYEDIENSTYEEFKVNNSYDLNIWCKKNDVFVKFG